MKGVLFRRESSARGDQYTVAAVTCGCRIAVSWARSRHA